MLTKLCYVSMVIHSKYR
uniref:Uncharacterized protein n=1 Tax=Lepeophtheirus salmonis TaxID=72036 RepID=A0A0K2SYH9_LEPSM